MKFSHHPVRFIVIVYIYLHSAFLFALDVPPLNGPVNDYARMFTASETQELNTYLYNIDRNSDLQIAVLTIPSLEGESLEDYSIRVAEKWQIGQKGKDSGIILVIAAQDRKLRIEVGYGLEDRITDAQSSRIIRSVIAPQFKKQEYGKGVLMGVKNLAGLALQDESLISESVKESDDQEEDSIPLPLIIFLVIILLFGSRFMPGGLLWPLFLLLSGRRGGYSSRGGGRFGGGFSGGSFGGGGFSGGGGSFGGGGSSGSW